MRNNIKTVNIYINQCNGSSCNKGEMKTNDMPMPISTSKDRGIFTKENVPEGVYIYTTNGFCIEPGFYGLYKETVVPVGVAIIDSEHTLLVALRGSDSGIVISNNTNTCKTSKQYDSLDSALTDWEGKRNTGQLAKAESPAAKYCLDYEAGNIKKGSWWLPSLAELNLMHKNKPLTDACLALCGGEVLKGYWYWSSTEYSKGANWVLDWNLGNRGSYYQNHNDRVRPVSAFL